MKNKEHSKLIKRLHNLKKQYNWYHISITISKENISLYHFDPYPERSFYSLVEELKDERFMVNEIQKEIKEIKNQIYLCQRKYSINYANQQPSQPLTKLEGSETNSII